jgi:hypothetical protein
MRRQIVLTLLLAGLSAGACGRPVIVQVDESVDYKALVPSVDQFAVPEARDIPGGFAALREAGFDQVALVFEGDQVTFRLDGNDVVTRRVVDRVVVRDKEGSGPFKAEKEVLVLGDDPLVLGGLSINEPVIWPGSFYENAVITIKPWDPEEAGPAVSCSGDEKCLLLSAGFDPIGRYEDANNPDLNENPIASIEISDEVVEFTLDTGQQFKTSRHDGSLTDACGLSQTEVWDVPAEVDLEMEDPVLVHTVCPTTPGRSIQLVILQRGDIPVLARLGAEFDGEWCSAGPDCLVFAPG